MRNDATGAGLPPFRDRQRSDCEPPRHDSHPGASIPRRESHQLHHGIPPRDSTSRQRDRPPAGATGLAVETRSRKMPSTARPTVWASTPGRTVHLRRSRSRPRPPPAQSPRGARRPHPTASDRRSVNIPGRCLCPYSIDNGTAKGSAARYRTASPRVESVSPPTPPPPATPPRREDRPGETKGIDTSALRSATAAATARHQRWLVRLLVATVDAVRCSRVFILADGAARNHATPRPRQMRRWLLPLSVERGQHSVDEQRRSPLRVRR